LPLALELGDQLADAMPYSKRLNEVADYIPAPDDRRQRLKLYPRADGTWSAQCDEFHAHRVSLIVTADDVSCFAPDWDAIRPALASALGFVPGAFKSPADVRAVAENHFRVAHWLATFFVSSIKALRAVQSRSVSSSGVRAMKSLK
jgi:hypothetical protein